MAFDFSIIFNEGVALYIVPFILVFAIIYGILSKTKIFAKNSSDGKEIIPKNFYMIVALAFGLLTVFGLHSSLGPTNSNLQSTFERAIPILILVAVALVLVYVLLAVGSVGSSPSNLFSGHINILGKEVSIFGLIFIALFIFVISIFAENVYLSGQSPINNFFSNNGDFFVSVLLPIVIFIVLIIFITKEPKTN